MSLTQGRLEKGFVPLKNVKQVFPFPPKTAQDCFWVFEKEDMWSFFATKCKRKYMKAATQEFNSTIFTSTCLSTPRTCKRHVWLRSSLCNHAPLETHKATFFIFTQPIPQCHITIVTQDPWIVTTTVSMLQQNKCNHYQMMKGTHIRRCYLTNCCLLVLESGITTLLPRSCLKQPRGNNVVFEISSAALAAAPVSLQFNVKMSLGKTGSKLTKDSPGIKSTHM